MSLSNTSPRYLFNSLQLFFPRGESQCTSSLLTDASQAPIPSPLSEGGALRKRKGRCASVLKPEASSSDSAPGLFEHARLGREPSGTVLLRNTPSEYSPGEILVLMSNKLLSLTEDRTEGDLCTHHIGLEMFFS